MVVLGRLVAPYGIKGWLHLHPFGDDPASWCRMSQWWLAANDAEISDWQSFNLADLRQHSGNWIAKLEGVDSRDASERLSGWYVAAPRAELPVTGAGEYYWADLIGLQAVNVQGVHMGAVDSIIETGAHHVVQLVCGKQTRLIPFIEQYVKEVDVAGGKLTVDWQTDW